ncbi:YchJ family protein [Aquimarina sp. W85]|uniref:YchJ family protein n=1 Tax=Aquimarina rhodophyticola TaxID=3342246 RepID=UPI00366EA2DB
MNNCPCGKKQPYNVCCAPIHTNIARAVTAEDLMRSRYTAFVMANGNYLMQSHHTTTRPINDKLKIITWAKAVQWIRLEILQVIRGSATDLDGEVHFIAYFFEDGQVQNIDEHSKFVRENDHWSYLGIVEAS